MKRLLFVLVAFVLAGCVRESYFDSHLTPDAITAIVAILIVVVAALVGIAILLTAKYVNRKRDEGYAVYCDGAMKKENSDLRAQNQALAKALVKSEKREVDLEARLKAVDHLATQMKLAITPGVDAAGGVGK